MTDLDVSTMELTPFSQGGVGSSLPMNCAGCGMQMSGQSWTNTSVREYKSLHERYPQRLMVGSLRGAEGYRFWSTHNNHECIEKAVNTIRDYLITSLAGVVDDDVPVLVPEPIQVEELDATSFREWSRKLSDVREGHFIRTQTSPSRSTYLVWETPR